MQYECNVSVERPLSPEQDRMDILCFWPTPNPEVQVQACPRSTAHLHRTWNLISTCALKNKYIDISLGFISYQSQCSQSLR